MTKPKNPGWTAKEDAKLRELVPQDTKSLPWKQMLKALPGRTESAIHCRMRKLGLMRKALNWSPEEDERLRLDWQRLSPKELKKGFPRRTMVAIYRRAKILGMNSGEPQGYADVPELARLLECSTLFVHTLMKWAGVLPRVFSYTRGLWRSRRPRVKPAPGKAKRRKQSAKTYYDRSLALEARTKWDAAELLEDATIRLNVSAVALRKWLEAEGLIPPPQPGLRRFFRAAPAVYDAVVAKHRTENAKVAAKRLKVEQRILIAALIQAKVEKRGHYYELAPGVAEAALAAYDPKRIRGCALHSKQRAEARKAPAEAMKDQRAA